MSLAAHSLLLLLPWYKPSVDSEVSDSAQDAVETVAEESAIAISTLPTSSQSGTPPSKPQSQPAAPPSPTTAPPVPSVAEPLPQPIPQSIQPPVQPQPVQPQPVQPQPVQELPIQPTPVEQQVIERPTESIASTPDDSMVVQLGENFPHLLGAQSGCYNLESCHRITGEGTHRQAAKKLIEQMRQQNYQVVERDDIESQGHQVFAVTPPQEPDKTYYLNVFSDSLNSAVYAITLEIVSLAELKQLSGQAAL